MRRRISVRRQLAALQLTLQLACNRHARFQDMDTRGPATASISGRKKGEMRAAQHQGVGTGVQQGLHTGLHQQA